MKKILNILMLFTLLGSVLLIGCKDNESTGDIDVSKDGVYITGVAAGGIDIKLKDAYVEGASFQSYKRAGMYELYIYLVAGELGIKIIAEDVETNYGPASALADSVMDGSGDQIIGTYKSGKLAANATAYSIPKNGFYQIVFDETSAMLWVVPVEKWEWVYDDTELATVSADAQKVVWEKTGVKFSSHQSKYRHSDGWKIVTEVPILAENEELTDGEYVIFFTNLGFNDEGLLESGAGNREIEKGVYTINLTWTIAEGFTSTLTKTGDVQNTDYSTYLLGFIGNGVSVADTSWGWGDLSYENKTPQKDGEIYTYTWNNVTIAANGNQEYSFKFRKDNAWDFTLGFNDVTMAGSAAADFFSGSGDGNFGVAEKKAYNFVLSVDADTDKWTLAVEPAQ